MILVIDNYDSFTFNIVQALQLKARNVQVYQNDKISLKDIQELKPEKIVISPGPGRPKDAGIISHVIETCSKTTPILGVCLGHQAIGEAFGARLKHAQTPIHGKQSSIHHEQEGIFQNIPSPFNAVQYNSLILDKETLPSCLKLTAWSTVEIEQHNIINEVMGIQHKTLPIHGIQFHPESILTEHGQQLINNFVYT